MFTTKRSRLSLVIGLACSIAPFLLIVFGLIGRMGFFYSYDYRDPSGIYVYMMVVVFCALIGGSIGVSISYAQYTHMLLLPSLISSLVSLIYINRARLNWSYDAFSPIGIYAVSWAISFIIMLVLSVAFRWISEGKEEATSTSTQSKFTLQDSAANADVAATRRAAMLREKLKDIEHVPMLRRMNGVGFTLLGRIDDSVLGQCYITVYWFIFLFIPLIPIRAYVVQYAGPSQYRFFKKMDLSDFHMMYADRLAKYYLSTIGEGAIFLIFICVIVGAVGAVFRR